MYISFMVYQGAYNEPISLYLCQFTSCHIMEHFFAVITVNCAHY